MQWMPSHIGKGNRAHQEISILETYYQNFLVSNYSSQFLKYSLNTSIIEPPTLMLRAGALVGASDSDNEEADDDHDLFFATPSHENYQGPSLAEWDRFAQRVLQKIGSIIVSYCLGEKKSKGGKPMRPETIQNFKVKFEQIENSNPLCVFKESFWRNVDNRGVFRNQKDFVEMISKIALPATKCPGSFHNFQGSSIRMFIQKSSRRFHAAHDNDHWILALTRAKSLIFNDAPLCILQINQDRSTEKLFTKNRKFDRLI